MVDAREDAASMVDAREEPPSMADTQEEASSMVDAREEVERKIPLWSSFDLVSAVILAKETRSQQKQAKRKVEAELI